MPSGIFFTLRRGLIAELRSFFDTIDMIEQLTGRDLIGPLLRETGAGACVRRRRVSPEPSCHGAGDRSRAGDGLAGDQVSQPAA